MKNEVMRECELFPFSMFGEMDHFMDTFSRPPGRRLINGVFPTCEVSEKNGHYMVSFDLPGIPRKEINVDLRDGKLHIYGERKEEHNQNDYTERRYGKFERIVTLPENVSTEDAEAIMENGVLTVALKVTEQSQAKKITIGDPKTSNLWTRLMGSEREGSASDSNPFQVSER